ncbi:energy-coupling factor transporter transmembrane protein EcfT [Bacillaceae bacterium Marseille-Q3522]|nr:energy-coupling factor transporter transmembrane protein EcfT [Bacillaceae bacterium Marseille-Q3522]
MNKLLLGRYIPGDSWIHQLDPRSKLICGFYFIFLLLFANNWRTYLLLICFTVLLMILSKVAIRIYFRGVRPLLWLILFTVFLQILFTGGGQVYLRWGVLTISSNGIMNGFYIFCRFVMLIFFAAVITFTTKPVELATALSTLLRPLRRFRVPVHDISLMLSVSLRFVPTLLDETEKIIDAQRARGNEFGEGNVFQQMKKIIPLFLPLFASSFYRAEQLADAMEVRGYQSNGERSSFRSLHWKKSDTFSLFILAVLTCLLVLLRS